MSHQKIPSSHYQIGLGAEALSRIRFIFIGLVALLLVTSGSTIYASYTSGQLRQLTIEPVKQLITDWETEQKRLEAEKQARKEARNFVNTYTSTSSSVINNNSKVNNSVNINMGTSQTKNNYVAPTAAPVQSGSSMKSYEERVKEMEAETAKKWAEALKKQAELSAQSKAANDAWFEEAKKKQQEASEAWKKEHGF